MTRSTLLLLFTAALVCSNANGQKSQKKLFNGSNLKGWYAYVASGKHENAADIFSVENGSIKLSGDENGYLMTLDTFRNFHLTVEYKWDTSPLENKKSKTKNSGIMYHVPAQIPDALWPRGIQFQVKEGATGDFVLLDNVTLTVKDSTNQPGKSVVMKRFTNAEKPIGEWNTVEISSIDGRCTQTLNGTFVNEGTNASVTSGRILLQYEGYPIYFRKVEMHPLSKSTKKVQPRRRK
jgi:hypothetical protein